MAEVLGVRPIELFIEERAQRAEMPALLPQRLARPLAEPEFVKLAELLARAYCDSPEQFRAIANVAAKSASPEHVGPKHVADFEEATDADERALVQRDAHERMACLIGTLKVEAGRG